MASEPVHASGASQSQIQSKVLCFCVPSVVMFLIVGLLNWIPYFQFIFVKNQNGKVTVGDLPPIMVKLKAFSEMFNEEEIRNILGESGSDMNGEIDFEGFLRVSI